MHIDSLDLIVSVYGSRNDYYKPENLNECRITYVIRRILLICSLQLHHLPSLLCIHCVYVHPFLSVFIPPPVWLVRV